MLGVLEDAEEKSPPLELDQVAYTLACFARANGFNPHAVSGLPKLTALIQEIGAQLEEHPAPTRFTRMLGLDPTRSKSLAWVKLQFTGWMDREDRVGDVVSMLLRE